jgi:hypothetical protein
MNRHQQKVLFAVIQGDSAVLLDRLLVDPLRTPQAAIGVGPSYRKCIGVGGWSRASVFAGCLGMGMLTDCGSLAVVCVDVVRDTVISSCHNPLFYFFLP